MNKTYVYRHDDTGATFVLVCPPNVEPPGEIRALSVEWDQYVDFYLQTHEHKDD